MKIAIISDIHENFHNLALFFKEIEKYDVKKIICLWDIINNGIAQILSKSKIPVFMIRWNNDWDKVAITQTALKKWSNLEVWFDTFDILQIDNRKIFLTHYPMLAKPMSKSWDFDAVFYWHNHKKNIDNIWDCLILNPWEISAHKSGLASFWIYDTETNTWKLLDIEQSMNLNTDIAKEHRESLNFGFSKTKNKQY